MYAIYSYNKNSYLYLKNHNKLIGGHNRKHPLASFILNDNGKIYVYNNIDNTKITTGTKFRIDSFTKVITAVVVLLFHERGLLNIKHKIKKYVSIDKDIDDVKIIDLLNHSSGLKRMPNDYRKNNGKRYVSASDVIKSSSTKNILNSGNNAYQYSNIGYLILGAIIEKVKKDVSWIDIFKLYIFEPLGMNDTDCGKINNRLYTTNDKLIYPIFSVNKLNKRQYNEVYYVATAGGLHSTMDDIMVFLKNVRKILNRKTLKIFDTLYFMKNGTIKHNGLIHGGYTRIKATYENNKLKRYKIYMSNISEPYINQNGQ